MEQPMDCAQAERRLWEYLDGALPPEEAARVRSHVAGCRGCGPACRCCGAFLALVARALRAQEGAPDLLRVRLRLLTTRER